MQRLSKSCHHLAILEEDGAHFNVLNGMFLHCTVQRSKGWVGAREQGTSRRVPSDQETKNLSQTVCSEQHCLCTFLLLIEVLRSTKANYTEVNENVQCAKI